MAFQIHFFSFDNVPFQSLQSSFQTRYPHISKSPWLQGFPLQLLVRTHFLLVLDGRPNCTSTTAMFYRYTEVNKNVLITYSVGGGEAWRALIVWLIRRLYYYVYSPLSCTVLRRTNKLIHIYFQNKRTKLFNSFNIIAWHYFVKFNNIRSVVSYSVFMYTYSHTHQHLYLVNCMSSKERGPHWGTYTDKMQFCSSLTNRK